MSQAGRRHDVAGIDINGTVEPGFEPVAEAFAANFAERGEVGAACCVYAGDRSVVDVWAGTTTPDGDVAYTERTLQMVASATKGALAICALRLAERGELGLDAPVATYWPEFAADGKAAIPVRWLLTHQAGVPAIDAQIPMTELITWQPAVAALAAHRPEWDPGTAHGYHAITYGWLVGEVIARITGTSPGRFFAADVAGPLGLDFHIGLDPAEHHRVAPLRPAPPPPPGTPIDDLSARIADPASLTHRAFFVSNGLFGMMNDASMWAAEVPAANGMATARALARTYAACIGEIDGVRLLASETVEQARATAAHGDDLVSGYETRYGLGFQLGFPYRPMAGPGSFGHYGLGGSVGFAHPELGFSFGYTVNQMGPGIPADPRSVTLVDAVVSCLHR